MTKKILMPIVSLLIILLLISPISAEATGQIVVSDSSAQIDFPLKLSMSSKITSTLPITDVRIRYKIEEMSFARVFTEASVPISESTKINANWSLDMRKIGGLPPGSNLAYWWLVKDSHENNVETSPISFQITDSRYSWNNLVQDKISLFWYSGDKNFANALMKTAQDSLTKLEQNTGVIPEKIINIYIYANNQDLLGSMIHPQEWTGGVAFTPYNIITIGISPIQLNWGKSAMTHELTHIVINQVVYNPYNNIPIWLNEGLAMYSEGPLDSQYSDPLEYAITENSLLSIRSICSPFSAYTDKSLLSYAESFSVVEYLISTYGSTKLSELLKTYKQGNTFDGAFLEVYGFDIDELNDLWKPWVEKQYIK
jgi:hypothetical protein